MKANVSISQIYYNASLSDFFFRTQAETTFNELCNRAKDLDDLFDAIENTYDDLDDFEEVLYNDTTPEIIEYLGSYLFEEEDE